AESRPLCMGAVLNGVRGNPARVPEHVNHDCAVAAGPSKRLRRYPASDRIHINQHGTRPGCFNRGNGWDSTESRRRYRSPTSRADCDLASVATAGHPNAKAKTVPVSHIGLTLLDLRPHDVAAGIDDIPQRFEDVAG